MYIKLFSSLVYQRHIFDHYLLAKVKIKAQERSDKVVVSISPVLATVVVSSIEKKSPQSTDMSKSTVQVKTLSFSYIRLYVYTHVKPLLHPIVRGRTSWLQRKNDLQGTVKVHMHFYNRILRSHRPCNEN